LILQDVSTEILTIVTGLLLLVSVLTPALTRAAGTWLTRRRARAAIPG
jgi:rhamnose transport system permease protein